MAKVGIFDSAPEKYFQYDNDTEVLIRHIDKDALAKLVRRSDEAAKKLKEDANTLLDIFLGKQAVRHWRKMDDHEHPGLVLPSGTPIPFNDDNRNMMMRRSSHFASFVLAKSTTAAGFLEEDDKPSLDVDGETLNRLLDELEEEGGPKNA